MKKIIMDETSNERVYFSDVNQNHPIFVKRKGCGQLCGMVVNEALHEGWIIRLGGSAGSSGHHDTLRKCIERGLEHDYEFFIY